MTQKLSQYIILQILPEDAKCQHKIVFGIEYPNKYYFILQCMLKNITNQHFVFIHLLQHWIFNMKPSFSSVRISLPGSIFVEAMALLCCKIFLVPDFAWLVNCYHMYIHSNAASRDIHLTPFLELDMDYLILFF